MSRRFRLFLSLSLEPPAVFSRARIDTAVPILDKALQVIGMAMTARSIPQSKRIFAELPPI
jgi:hypothetical protein